MFTSRVLYSTQAMLLLNLKHLKHNQVPVLQIHLTVLTQVHVVLLKVLTNRMPRTWINGREASSWRMFRKTCFPHCDFCWRIKEWVAATSLLMNEIQIAAMSLPPLRKKKVSCIRCDQKVNCTECKQQSLVNDAYRSLNAFLKFLSFQLMLQPSFEN